MNLKGISLKDWKRYVFPFIDILAGIGLCSFVCIIANWFQSKRKNINGISKRVIFGFAIMVVLILQLTQLMLVHPYYLHILTL